MSSALAIGGLGLVLCLASTMTASFMLTRESTRCRDLQHVFQSFTDSALPVTRDLLIKDVHAVDATIPIVFAATKDEATVRRGTGIVATVDDTNPSLVIRVATQVPGPCDRVMSYEAA